MHVSKDEWTHWLELSPDDRKTAMESFVRTHVKEMTNDPAYTNAMIAERV